MALSGATTISVVYDNIKVVVNGVEITPTDANGNVVEPFQYNGTTYLPVRAIASALGKSVSYSDVTNTVSINSVTMSTVTLSTGYYIGGINIASGTYYCKAISGNGNFIVKDASGNLIVNEMFGVDGGYYTGSFSNLTIGDNYSIEITSGLSIKFIPNDALGTSASENVDMTVREYYPNTKIPTLESVTGMVYYKSDISDGDTYRYYYTLTQLTADGLDEYSQKLIDSGFSYIKTIDHDNGSSSLLFANYYTGYVLGFGYLQDSNGSVTYFVMYYYDPDLIS